MKKNYKILFILILIIVITIAILSYYGMFFFTENFNEFDYLIFNIIGDSLLVGIVTHISSKNISTFISKKEFDRNNKLNITINKSRNIILNYKSFMNLYENQEVYFALDEDDRKILNNIYELYNYLLNSLEYNELERKVLDTILNIPFTLNYYDYNSISECYNSIVNKSWHKNNLNNISAFNKLMEDDILKSLERFSNILLNLKHYEITNLNNIEGCQILITSDNIVACKIPCLPNHRYNVFAYYDNEHRLDFIGFSFDYNSKEYATNLSSMKYTNDTSKLKSAHINLNEYIQIKS